MPVEMSRDRGNLGRFGERIAEQHLLAQGYGILQRNFRTPSGEIDIIAQKDGCVVFVEVRTRRGGAPGEAAESIASRKQAHLVDVAQAYVQSLSSPPAAQRIDVITLSLAPDGRVVALDHIEDAVSGRP